jgi:hypothetical protein
LPNNPKLGWKHLWAHLSKGCSFRPDPFTNIVATAILVSDWVISKKFRFIWPSGFRGEDLKKPV